MRDQICPNPTEQPDAVKRLQNEFLIELYELEASLWRDLQDFWLEAPRLKAVKEAEFNLQRQREFRQLLLAATGRSELVEILQEIKEHEEQQLEYLLRKRNLALELFQDWLAICRLLPAAYFLTLPRTQKGDAHE